MSDEFVKQANVKRFSHFPAILILRNFTPYRRSLVQVQGAKRSPQETVLLPEFP
jgi:hypothetical protein